MNETRHFLYTGLLMLPTCIAQIIPRIRHKNTAPYLSFFFCICCNVGIGLLLSYFFVENDKNDTNILISSIVFLVVGYFPQIIPFSICCCPTSFECNNFLIGTELFRKFESHKNFCEKLAKNRAFAPVITVSSEASHTEIYTVTSTDSKGRTTTETRTRKVVTYRNKQEFHYNSWQEEGNSIRVWPGTTVIHAVIKTDFKFDSEAKNALNWLRNFMYHDAKKHDVDVNVSVDYDVPGMTKSLCGTSMDDESKLPLSVVFLKSCFGKLFFILFTIVGYQSILNAIWSSHGERLCLKLVKKISMRPKCNGFSAGGGSHINAGLRAGYLEKDIDAIGSTFFTDLIEAPINEPLVNYTEQYEQPLEYSPYYSAYMETPYYQNFVDSNYVGNTNFNDFPEVEPSPYLPTPPN